MAIIARQLAEQLKASNPELATATPPRALLSWLRQYRRIVVGGECYTIEKRLRELGGQYVPTSREWAFVDADEATLNALAEVIVYKNLITVRGSQQAAGSPRISVASLG